MKQIAVLPDSRLFVLIQSLEPLSNELSCSSSSISEKGEKG